MPQIIDSNAKVIPSTVVGVYCEACKNSEDVGYEFHGFYGRDVINTATGGDPDAKVTKITMEIHVERCASCLAEAREGAEPEEKPEVKP